MVSGGATIELHGTQYGGLQDIMPSGTRSPLVRFDDSLGDETLGVVIEAVDDAALHPGISAHVRLSFWSDAARNYGAAGATFSLWYGREVGRGIITDPIE
jgi:hypothetical protein